SDGEPRSVRLSPGESLTFSACTVNGCGLAAASRDSPPCTVGLMFRSDHWTLSNRGPSSLIVDNLEYRHEYFSVAAGRVDVPIPFVRSSVGNTYTVELDRGAARQDEAGSATPCHHCDSEPGSSTMDTSTIYFNVLQELCRPRLERGPGSSLPTSREIAKSLREKGHRLSPRAVDAHIDYLLDKLGARPSDDDGGGNRRGWKRESLVARALRLRLLPQHSRAST
ncbi:MAG: hypothetical protein ACRD0P_02375, partial [Stackebrandtia sp.]